MFLFSRAFNPEIASDALDRRQVPPGAIAIRLRRKPFVGERGDR
jgi:hypothetical protein